MAYEITTNPLRGVEAKPGSGHYGVFEHGAQVWSWRPDGAAPVLWVSEKSWFAEGQPVRGGVPVCFPWFGPGSSGDLQPSHGFARLHTWHLSDTKDTLDRDGRLIVEYRLDEAMTGQQDNWPHRYKAYVRAKFTPEYVRVELEVTNDGDEPITFDGALHTYLAVSDIRTVTITGLEGASYLDKVTGATETQDGPLTLTGETDRVFTSADEVVVDDPGLGRKLVISKSGSANTIVWNPWAEKSAEVADLGDDEWQGFVCVEAGNVLGDAITLLPGQVHCLKQRIALA